VLLQLSGGVADAGGILLDAPIVWRASV